MRSLACDCAPHMVAIQNDPMSTKTPPMNRGPVMLALSFDRLLRSLCTTHHVIGTTTAKDTITTSTITRVGLGMGRCSRQAD